MTITSQVWNGKTFVNTDSDTVDQKNVNDGAPTSGTLWTSVKVSNELATKAEKEHMHLVSQVSGLHPVATTGNYQSLTNKPTIPPAYSHPNDTNTRHVTDTEKSTWNSKANTNHTHDYASTNHAHTIANITGLRTELDSIKASVSGNNDKIPSGNWKISPKDITIRNTHDFQMCIGHIKLSYLDAIRVNLPTQSIVLHTVESARPAYLNRTIYLIPMTQVGKPAIGDTSGRLPTNDSYVLYRKGYDIDAATASTQYILEGVTVDVIPLTRDKLNPGYYAVYAFYSVGNVSGTLYTAFSAQTTSTNCYIGYDE